MILFHFEAKVIAEGGQEIALAVYDTIQLPAHYIQVSDIAQSGKLRRYPSRVKFLAHGSWLMARGLWLM